MLATAIRECKGSESDSSPNFGIANLGEHGHPLKGTVRLEQESVRMRFERATLCMPS